MSAGPIARPGTVPRFLVVLRRACASLVLAALVAQTSVSLYACHRFPPAVHFAPSAPGHHESHAGHGRAARDVNVASSAAGASHSLPGHVCNRHERGRCPHAHGATIGTCASDPVPGSHAGSDSGVPSHTAATLVARQVVPLLPAAGTAPPGAIAPIPELPPPRV